MEHQPHRREPVRDRRPRPARRRRDGCIRAHGRAAHGRRHARAPDALERVRRAAAARGRLHRRHRRRRCARHQARHAAHRDLRRRAPRPHRRRDEPHLRCRRAAGHRRADADRHGLLPRHQRHAHDRAHRRAQLCRARQLHAPPPAASGHTDAAHGGDRRVRGHPRAHGGRRAGSTRDACMRHLRRLDRGKRAAAPAGGAPARRRDRKRERDAGRHQGRPAGGRRRRPRGEAPRRRGREALCARRARAGGHRHGARQARRKRSHPPALPEQAGAANPGHVRADDGGLPRARRHGARAGRAHLVLRAHAVEGLHAKPLRPRGRHSVVAGV